MNPLYLRVDHVNGYIEEKEVNKYLVFDSKDENKELLKKYVFNGIRNKIKKISGDECDYEKDYMKIKFNSDDDLPLNKQLKFHNMTISIISVFEEDDKLYPQAFLDDTLYELNVRVLKTLVAMLEYDWIDISEVIDVNKTNLSKECELCHYWYFKNVGFKYESYFCNGCHDLMQKAISFNNIVVVYVKWNVHRINFKYMSKDDAINIMNGSNLDDKRSAL